MADDLLRLVLDHLRSKGNRTIFVSGSIGSGKTSLSQETADGLEREGYEPGGVLSPRVLRLGKTVGYDVVDLATGHRRSFVRSNPPGRRLGRFFIKPGALEFANKAISEAAGEETPVFVDEVGKLELENDGLAPSVRSLLASNSQPVLLVRDDFVPEVLDFFEVGEYDEIAVGGS